MTVTLTNAPPPANDEKVASPRAGRRSNTSPRANLSNLLLDRSCSPLLRALCVATLLSVVAVLALTGERDDPRRPERTARAARSRVAASPLTTLTTPDAVGDEDTALDSDFSLEQAALTWSHRLDDDNFSDTPGVMRFGSVKVHQSIVERVVKAAQTTEMDPALLMAIADKESNFSSTAKAKTSSASGLFQFVEKTWLKAVKTFGWRHGHSETAAAIASDDAPRVNGQKRAQILNLRNDPYLSAVLAAEMLKKDGARIAEKIGRQLTPGETYLIHFLGPDDAERFMRTVEEAPHTSAAALLPRPARANKPIFYEQQGRRLKVRSVQEVHEAFETMMDKRTSRYEDVVAKLPGGATAYAE
jgi:hypothetical protein